MYITISIYLSLSIYIYIYIHMSLCIYIYIYVYVYSGQPTQPAARPLLPPQPPEGDVAQSMQNKTKTKTNIFEICVQIS